MSQSKEHSPGKLYHAPTPQISSSLPLELVVMYVKHCVVEIHLKYVSFLHLIINF